MPPDQSTRPEWSWWLTAFLASRQTRLCLVVALVVVLMPPESGLGVELCLLKRVSGAPCPGCGVTRSGSNLVRGRVSRAIQFHPFGLILHPVLLGLVVLSVLPDALRQAFARRLLPWRRWLSSLHALFWIAFFVFGLARWSGVMAGALTFPPAPSEAVKYRE